MIYATARSIHLEWLSHTSPKEHANTSHTEHDLIRGSTNGFIVFLDLLTAQPPQKSTLSSHFRTAPHKLLVKAQRIGWFGQQHKFDVRAGVDINVALTLQEGCSSSSGLCLSTFSFGVFLIGVVPCLMTLFLFELFLFKGEYRVIPL